MLVEAVTIEVGAALAKSVLKLWVKDSALGNDITSSLIDLLKAKTSDTLAQRRGNRQFENIGERIGEGLLPLFQIEDTHLDEGSRTAVALAVAEAFNQSKLSSELVAEHNLEPMKLAKHILLSASPEVTQLFSSAETAFYQRVVEESCKYIVDIASQLPNFTEQTFAELLKREDQIIAKTNEILKEFRRIREQLNPIVGEDQFEIDYRDAVKRNLDVLQLLGLDTSPSNRRHRLSVAYITLSMVPKSLPSSEDGHRPPATGPFPANLAQQTERRQISVDEALTLSNRFLIRGLAGSGKTTLLQWIAVRSATKTFEGKLSNWNNTIPFFIRLRNCIRSSLPGPEAFPGLVAPVIAAKMPPGWAHAQFATGRAIVLIDGVDEVSTQQREHVRVWLTDLVETYPQARFIVTSRPTAIEEAWIAHEKFRDAELQPMEMADISIFIERWHQALREELSEDEEKKELAFFAEHLKEEVRRSRSIRNLATNPLLCAMLCVLHRDRRKQLPEDRIEIYESCCYLMLERREKAREINLSDYPVLNYRQKRLLLEDLAYWMIRNDFTQVEQQEVDLRFAHKITDMPGISKDTSGSDVRRLLVERASILREPVAGRIDFAHRTFQEFLAAKAAREEIDIGLLVANAHNDQWREVIILASGLANKPVCEELIKRLIVRGDREVDHRYQLHLLAVACLETSVELGREVKYEIDKRLRQLVPPKSLAEGQSLAAAGELAVKHLARSEAYSEAIVAICIQTLALIGGDAAQEMLEDYTHNAHRSVIDELLRAWDHFDRETYASRILVKILGNKSNLHLRGLPSLEGIQYFTNLTDLTLSDSPRVSDLSPLVGLSQLTFLDLSLAQIKDLSPLTSLPQLKRLKLFDCNQLADLSPLTKLPNLEEVTVSDNFDLTQIPTNIAGILDVVDRISISSRRSVGADWSQIGVCSCGHPYPPGARFCPHCGQQMQIGGEPIQDITSAPTKPL